MQGDLGLRLTLIEYRLQAVLLWVMLEEFAAKHNPDWHLQPRVPQGNPEGGRWTDGAIPANRRVIVTAAVAAAAKIIARIRAPLIKAMSIVPLPVTLNAPPLLLADEHFRWEPSPRRPYMPYMEFDHYQQFLAGLLSAGSGYEWHHIVEQRMTNPLRPGGVLVFPERSVQNSDNLILLPRDVHACVTTNYASGYVHNGVRYRNFRSFLDTQPWSVHYLLGIRYIRQCQRRLASRGGRRRGR